MDQSTKPSKNESTRIAPGSEKNIAADVQVRRFWLLDNLRGLAALSVVVFHYEHFYFTDHGALPSDFDRSIEPFYSFLWVFYDMGYNAVQLFFVLSGFVFFFVYYKALCERKLFGSHYFVARFSRLYPLHFATLLTVAAGQWYSVKLTGQYTVYPYNDLYHFVLNLFFASNWGFQLGESFNGPVWSLSVEVVVYLVFYIYAVHVATRSPKHVRNALLAFGISLIIWRLSPSATREIARAATCFFAGGLIFFAWQKIASLKASHQVYALAIIGFTGAVSVLLFIVTQSHTVLHILIFPALVLFLAVMQALDVAAGKRFCFLGDASYSIYLLHFPLQLCIILGVAALGISLDYDNPVVFLGFFALLLAFSLITFHWFEKPIQNYLRAKMLS
jgi:peptidoglycan/LPS O-acetylase OafA/YrhL